MSASSDCGLTLLGGRVQLPANHGLPPTTDTLFLAAAVSAQPGMRVLDAGAGSGAAALCLAARVEGVQVTALEREAAPAQAARDNKAANAFGDRLEVVEADLAQYVRTYDGKPLDAVMTNPPYLDPATTRGSPDPLRHAATVESMTLAAWVDACMVLLVAGGELVLVHRSDREVDVLAALEHHCRDITIMDLRAGGAGDAPARRVLVRAIKGSDGLLRRAEPMVLHGADGRYTASAEGILRQGKPLTWLANRAGDTT